MHNNRSSLRHRRHATPYRADADADVIRIEVRQVGRQGEGGHRAENALLLLELLRERLLKFLGDAKDT